ncbi:aromatic alcohol reductase [Mycolicibacterium holsaticum]|uniref:aromatic alcohol reductase n=1 Tax=Mycolicibacterium holsaticum TaxID=152142 RepID=UPI001C7DA112|nr:aromatic alcohol reductase [Mycolicibacterium holsaticum]MDA4107804.1 2'-hydroxyisoflavone reductase [Mycolicibacterium holsaticum DSM 44478 = JCM 12374]QZA14752.1 aromatic alcohol reductase [Mycolicibacterium holsaticum DSM 44478 = JCM 12374]UNC07805.1 aromatic alcohol reductase [Mycolicibacterium holsaticum DSM 44478 = JCM 12374]
MASQQSPDGARILVIGAGELGGNVVAALTHRDDAPPVTVLLRPSGTPRHAQLRDQFAARGVGIVEADVATASTAELSTVLRQFHTVVSCIGFAAGAGTQRKITEAALAARVPRYLPWQFGVDYDAIGRGSPHDLFDEQLDVRDMLRAQSITEWVIVSTGMFTSFLFEPAFGVVDLTTNTVNALGSWDTEVTVTTPEDIGVLTAEIIQTSPRIANQVVYVAGDTITYRELADIVERTTGAQVIRNEWTVAQLLHDLDRNPGDRLRKYRAVFAQGNGVAWPKTGTFNAIRGIPTTTAEQWARKHLSARH